MEVPRHSEPWSYHAGSHQHVKIPWKTGPDWAAYMSVVGCDGAALDAGRCGCGVLETLPERSQLTVSLNVCRAERGL